MFALAATLPLMRLAQVVLPGTLEAVCHFQPTTQQVPGSGLDPRDSVMYITSVPGQAAKIEVQTMGQTPGLHGIHIHDYGDLSDTVAGTSTGPHYNPLEEIHGCYPTPPGEIPSEARKVGDMGNVIVNEGRVGFYTEEANELIFLDGAISVMGRGTIIHALEVCHFCRRSHVLAHAPFRCSGTRSSAIVECVCLARTTACARRAPAATSPPALASRSA
jgi:Cu/Zn superoxide dismutase